MLYSRINLNQTNYEDHLNWKFLNDGSYTDTLNSIYRDYCRHKKFKSVMPIFDSEYTDSSNDVIGYYHHNNLVAFSLIRKYDCVNIEAIQFAWDYKAPSLKLGIKSLMNECAIYKKLGYKYLYLGEAAKYKKIDGYEELGPI